MNSGWVKFFADGTREDGFDHLVDNRQASWSRGRLTGMVRTEVVHNGIVVLSINGLGNFWQSDDFEISMITNKSKRCIRRIQFEIGSHTGMIINSDLPGLHASVRYDRFAKPAPGIQGKWLTLEYNCLNNSATEYLSERR